MHAADERQLIQQVRDGNARAFTPLVERHMRQVYNVAFSIVRDHDEANDVAQETFIRAYRAINSFRGDSEFRTWIYRIAMNLSLNVQRRRKHRDRDVRIDTNAVISEVAADGHGVGSEALITSALDELSELQRKVVVLRHVDGLSTKDVSVILQCTEGTVKTHLHRGLKKLKVLLAFLKEDR